MSNQTVDVLKALYMKAWELHRCNPPRDNGRSLQAIWINDLSALVDQFVREQQALPDREKELMAEINQLAQDNIKLIKANAEVANINMDYLVEKVELEQQVKDLQQQHDSLKAKHEYEVRQLAHEYKESLHHEAEKFNHRKIEIERQLEYLSRGVAKNQLMQPIQMQACADCPKLKMIDMGEHHE